MVSSKKWLFSLGPKISIFGPKLCFLPFDPKFCQRPIFDSLGGTVHFQPWDWFFDFLFPSYTRQKVFLLPTVGAQSASNSPSALSARAWWYVMIYSWYITTYHVILVIKIKNIIFVRKSHNYVIYDPNSDYALIDSFQGSYWLHRKFCRPGTLSPILIDNNSFTIQMNHLGRNDSDKTSSPSTTSWIALIRTQLEYYSRCRLFLS